jgi:hypothetical protein
MDDSNAYDWNLWLDYRIWVKYWYTRSQDSNFKDIYISSKTQIESSLYIQHGFNQFFKHNMERQILIFSHLNVPCFLTSFFIVLSFELRTYALSPQPAFFVCVLGFFKLGSHELFFPGWLWATILSSLPPE